MTSKRDLSRFDALQRIGCIACRILGVHSQADVHHVLTGGRRTGHQDTIPLCPYHHRGVLPASFIHLGGDPEKYDSFDAGPSLANGSKPFHARFGRQEELLQMVNSLISVYAK